MEGIHETAQTITGLPAGSHDHISAQEQMRAIDYALRIYFDTDHWLKERDEKMPGLRRS